MKNSIKWTYNTLFIFSLFLFTSCNNDDDSSNDLPNPTGNLENEINDFIWKGMNKHYYWQEDVSNLADSKFKSDDEYVSFLNSYSEPSELFFDLLYQPGVTDRNSGFIQDYEAYESSRRGVDDSFGFNFDLVFITSINQQIAYITYVIPNSPASDAGLKRGDIIIEFNDIALTQNNRGDLRSAYYNDDHIKLALGELVDGEFVATGKEEDLALRQVAENPIQHYEIIEQGGKKIGYLVYTGFVYTYHEELNNVFKEFKDGGITELILDLRYNGGGANLTSTYLASMIDGSASESEIYHKLIYNSKNADENFGYNFQNNIYFFDKTTGSVTNNGAPAIINRLNTINTLYVLTTDGTASASELIINGLRPFMDVFLIGETTYGKNVGSFTIYDSPDFSDENINPNHKFAIQPISFQVFNKNDESNYADGFAPDIEVLEYQYAASGLKAFGDIEEPLLNAALNQISGVIARSSLSENRKLDAKKVSNNSSSEMYVLPNEKGLIK